MIIGVAIRNKEITVRLPKPNRHNHCFLYLHHRGIPASDLGIGSAAKDQGFYTHTGKYLDREQAFRYVKRIKQSTTGPIKHALFSEDLW